jgi:hypothetical protein
LTGIEFTTNTQFLVEREIPTFISTTIVCLLICTVESCCHNVKLSCDPVQYLIEFNLLQCTNKLRQTEKKRKKQKDGAAVWPVL